MTKIEADIRRMESEPSYWVVVHTDNEILDRIPCRNAETAEKVKACIDYENERQAS